MLFVFGIFVVFLYANLMVYTLKKKGSSGVLCGGHGASTTKPSFFSCSLGWL